MVDAVPEIYCFKPSVDHMRLKTHQFSLDVDDNLKGREHLDLTVVSTHLYLELHPLSLCPDDGPM